MTKNSAQEEKELLESYERGEWKPVAEIEAWRSRLQSMAASAKRKQRRLNIRLSERDLRKLQSKALEEGIPYQTLISSVLHKYVTAKLKMVEP